MENLFRRIRSLELKQKIIVFIILFIVLSIILAIVDFVLNLRIVDLIIVGIIGWVVYKIFIQKK